MAQYARLGPCKPGEVDVTIQKQHNERSFGMRVAAAAPGGVDINGFDPPTGAAGRSGLLAVGDRIVGLNGVDVTKLSFANVVSIMTRSHVLHMRVCRWQGSGAPQPAMVAPGVYATAPVRGAQPYPRMGTHAAMPQQHGGAPPVRLPAAPRLGSLPPASSPMVGQYAGNGRSQVQPPTQQGGAAARYPARPEQWQGRQWPGAKLPTRLDDATMSQLRVTERHPEFRGVFFAQAPGVQRTYFSVKLHVDGKETDFLSMGVFTDPVEAAQFHDVRVIEAGGEAFWGYTNFLRSLRIARRAVVRLTTGQQVFPLPAATEPARKRRRSKPAPAPAPSESGLPPGCMWVHAVVTQEQRERVTKHIFAASFLSKHQMPPAKYLPGYDPSQDPANAVQHSDWTRRSYRRNTSHKNVEFFQRKMMKQRKRRRRRKKDWEDESESDGENFALSARLTKKLSSQPATVRRSSRNTTKKKYTFDTESEDEAEKADKDADKSSSDSAPVVEDIGIDVIVGVRFNDAAYTTGFKRTLDYLEFLVKWKNTSYQHVEWVAPVLIKKTVAARGKAKRFLATEHAQAMLDEDELAEREHQAARARLTKEGKDPDSAVREYKENREFVTPEYLEVDRILESKQEPVVDPVTLQRIKAHGELNKSKGKGKGKGKGGAGAGPGEAASQAAGHPGGMSPVKAQPLPATDMGSNGTQAAPADLVAATAPTATMYLVKWRRLGYLDATWEWAIDVADAAKVAQFMRFSRAPRLKSLHPAALHDVRPPVSDWAKYAVSPEFNGNRELRDYQLEGLNWLVFNWYQRRNCILADEMGLGKTIQTLAFLDHLFKREHVRGPFLVVAPLSTLQNWKRELESWTDMNTVVYHDSGGGKARDLLRSKEFEFSARHTSKNIFKFHVLLTTYQALVHDWEHLAHIHWRAVTIDEAHNLRNRASQILQCVKAMHFDCILLLTGTPVHNNIQELWTLLNLLDHGRFSHLETFLEEYGRLAGPEHVAKLQRDLRPLLLRRVKEDVEKSIPPKTETIIHVELTTLQKKYYRAIFERNRRFLSKRGKQVAQLINIEMELRKCCNHPFLIRGLEQRELPKSGLTRTQLIVRCAGKLALLNKLLPKLRREGHKVLIFSQFNIMLDVLSDFCADNGFPYERIDGSVHSSLRQPAIDRFNSTEGNSFVFLLTTRAGGVGINLTAADTVIIYDSDWNPQNDLQAIARCHRIGQTETVRIYRLITKKTYEAEMFRRAGRKLGLSQAVFETGGMVATFMGNNEDEHNGHELSTLAKLDVDKVEMLLKFGAYALLDEEDDSADTFYNNDIDTILKSSTTQVLYQDAATAAADGSKQGNGTAPAPGAGGAGAGGDGAGSATDAAGGAATNGGGDGSADGDGPRASPAPATVSFAKATFAAASADANLDVQDPAFWEKVLGPKAVDRLWKQVREGTVFSADDDDVTKFINDVEALIIEVLDVRQQGTIHQDTDTLQSLIIELQVRGALRKVPPPLAARMPQARPTLKEVARMWTKALNAKHRRRGAGQHAHLVSLLPEPSTNKRRRTRTVRSAGTKEEEAEEADDWVPPAAKRARRKPAASPRNGGGKSTPRSRASNGRRAAGGGKRSGSKKSAAHGDAAKPWVLKLGEPKTEGGAAQHTQDHCYVCRVTEGFADNPIVFCDSCNVAVHQYCYGITDIPQGDDPWLCSPCAAKQVNPTCVMCSLSGGAFKRTNKGAWVHCVCALWCEDCGFGDLSTLEPVHGVGTAMRNDDNLGECSVCKNTGVLTKCSVPRCNERYHAICGRRTGKLMVMNVKHELVAFCDNHRAAGVVVESAANAAARREAKGGSLAGAGSGAAASTS